MIAMLARRLTLTLFLAFLFVALLEQFNPAPPRMLVDFHLADYPVCMTVRNGPIERRDHYSIRPYNGRKVDRA